LQSRSRGNVVDTIYPVCKEASVYPARARRRTLSASADFALFIAQIRQDYGRRPSLMKALDAKGL
jgi:hypothetical protein